MNETPEVDREALEGWLEESEARLRQLPTPTHHTFLRLYQRRADVLHALGAEPASVVRELVMAARCYAAHGSMFLERWPVSRIRPRRLAPLELALIAREAHVMEAITTQMGVDVLPMLADVCDDALQSEIRAVTGGPLSGEPAGPGAALGSLALLYWACLSALLREDGPGFDAARLQARSVRDAVTLPDTGPARRMHAAHDALTALRPQDRAAFEAAWRAHLDASGDEAPEALDRGALALGCAAQAAGVSMEDFDVGVPRVTRHLAYVLACTAEAA